MLATRKSPLEVKVSQQNGFGLEMGLPAVLRVPGKPISTPWRKRSLWQGKFFILVTTLVVTCFIPSSPPRPRRSLCTENLRDGCSLSLSPLPSSAPLREGQRRQDAAFSQLVSSSNWGLYLSRLRGGEDGFIFGTATGAEILDTAKVDLLRSKEHDKTSEINGIPVAPSATSTINAEVLNRQNGTTRTRESKISERRLRSSKSGGSSATKRGKERDRSERKERKRGLRDRRGASSARGKDRDRSSSRGQDRRRREQRRPTRTSGRRRLRSRSRQRRRSTRQRGRSRSRDNRRTYKGRGRDQRRDTKRRRRGGDSRSSSSSDNSDYSEYSSSSYSSTYSESESTDEPRRRRRKGGRRYNDNAGYENGRRKGRVSKGGGRRGRANESFSIYRSKLNKSSTSALSIDNEVLDEILSRKIYVAGFAPSTREIDLRMLFDSCGEVKEIFLPHNRKFAFVEFTNKDGADKAIKEKFGTVLNEHRLNVVAARKRSYTPQNKPCKELFVGAIPYGTQPAEVQDMMEVHAEVTGIIMKKASLPGTQSYAFIRFASTEDAAKALEAWSGKMFKDSVLRIDYVAGRHRRRYPPLLSDHVGTALPTGSYITDLN